MKRKIIGLTIFGFFILTSFNYDSEILFQLGNNTCKLLKFGLNNKLATFISLHDNENTSVEAFMSAKPNLKNIVMFDLNHSGDRLLKYKIQGKEYFFDPNRIFSITGIKNTILKCNRTCSTELEMGIKSFADTLLQIIMPKSATAYVVAIHNNGNNDFSVLSYNNSKDADDVFVNNTEDVDNFFIVTTKADFEYFKSIKRNVVIQSRYASDDGSLSIYCQKNNIPYINIEAEHGQLKVQMKMIEEAYLLINNKIK